MATDAPPASAPIWLVVAAGVSGLGVGHLLGSRLQTFDYRLEEEADRPRRLPGWVVTAGLGPLWAALAWKFGIPAGWLLLPALLTFATVALALTWVDLDIHRLPEGLTLPSLPILLGQVTFAAWATGDWGLLVRAVLGAAFLGVLGLLLALLAALLRSGFGLGDVVLLGLIGLVTGSVGWAAPVLALYAAFLLGGAYALVHVVVRRRSRHDSVPFGPFLVAGAIIALLVEVPPLL
ncbi:MAG: prepilin peptidase [Intrasporangium sp.]|uniref:prepilin peptidase n=1 Tax=Intrasporangium sp. TaxID=1925024 RepID=UPI0026470962|nr:prepilin peptidase [Intrasporangium sp.]MDN5794166.1 prepilin peptidase [Intrasporangium sp.]